MENEYCVPPFSVQSGEILGLIGPNGAGKTTLFDCVAGVAPASSGEVRLEGNVVPAEERKRILFYLPDGMRPWADQRVRWLLRFAHEVYGSGGTIDARIVDALGIHPLLASRLGTLSKGEHKRVMLAMALQSSQRLLLLDEPSLGRAPLMVRKIFDTIRQLRAERGTTILLVEQNAFQALKLADRAYVMVNGRIAREATGVELMTDPAVQSAYLEGGLGAAETKEEMPR